MRKPTDGPSTLRSDNIVNPVSKTKISACFTSYKSPVLLSYKFLNK